MEQEKEIEWKDELVNVANYKMVRDFMFFGYNYPHDWIEQVWKGDSIAKHLRTKFYDLCYKHSSSGHAYCEFFFEMDDENKKKLVTWISENYKA